MAKQKSKSIAITEETIFRKIYLIRGHKVMLDADLAELYEVETRVLNQAVKRNINRFPKDFMFQLTKKEFDDLRSQNASSKDESSTSQNASLNNKKVSRSQIVILKKGSGHNLKYLPFAFTEQGVSMLSTVLKSQRAIEVNIGIMRIFVKMRQMISGYKELLEKVEKMEATLLDNNEDIENIYSIIKELLEPALKDRTPIGYKTPKPKKG